MIEKTEREYVKFKDKCNRLKRLNIEVLKYKKHADYCDWLRNIDDLMCAESKATFKAISQTEIINE